MTPEVALKKFITSGIVGRPQKDLLKRMAYIEYTYGSWNLTEKGRAEAKRLGFI